VENPANRELFRAFPRDTSQDAAYLLNACAGAPIANEQCGSFIRQPLKGGIGLGT